ncbi:gustatory receptor for sugar taste 43a-like isoform X2 [Cydia pomonella]|uniref:gustatory receptor for sugar taste 43a-like isoform X2 n=1 Tax=Cydia pomonella TaxID=82600 RepID=UPI002ADDDE22|nr:gustatory receptor for sugar taste 43a-like isoform X2 [Cydia pomonella]
MITNLMIILFTNCGVLKYYFPVMFVDPDLHKDVPPVCVVSGALALLLRASSYAGVCPLRFTQTHDGWRPSPSAPLAAVQRLIMTIFNALMLAAFILDICQEPGQYIRIGETTLKMFVWCSDMLLMMMIASVAVYMAPKRMNHLVHMLDQLRQVSTELKMNPSARNEKIKSIAIVFIPLWAASILIADFYSFLGPLMNGKMWYIMCMYGPYYVGNFMGILVLLQWSCAVLAVHATVVAVNDELATLRRAKFDLGPTTTLEDLLRPPKPERNTLVGCFTKPAKSPGNSMTLPQAQATIRRLAFSHERISELMRQLNASNGVFLMFVLMSTFIRLVLTPYYLLQRFDHDERILYELLLQINWTLFHVITLLLTIEPCHWTQEQRERTQILLSHLIVHLAPKCERLSKELDQFAKQILLSGAKYMPLGVYTLARPLMATILGGVTTYLVIIIQFQKISDQL